MENLGKLLLIRGSRRTLTTTHNVFHVRKGPLLITFPGRTLHVRFHYLVSDVFLYGSYLAPLLPLVTDPRGGKKKKAEWSGFSFSIRGFVDDRLFYDFDRVNSLH